MKHWSKLKICGITREADLTLCIGLGIPFVGFNFYPGSKRYLDPESAQSIWRNQAIHGQTKAIAVVVGRSPVEIGELLAHFPDLAGIQCHGEEDEKSLLEIRTVLEGRLLWRTVHVTGPSSIADADKRGSDLLLFDAPKAGDVLGGTGVRFPLEYLEALRKEQRPFGVAGGIQPSNVESLRPYAPELVDVASGAEVKPGLKDAGKVEALWRALIQ